MDNRLIVSGADIYPDDTTVIKKGTLIAADGKVEALLPAGTDTAGLTGRRIDGSGLNLLPGFIDVHVHGGYGHEFMDASQANLEQFSTRTLAEGCTAFYASLVCGYQDELVAIMTTYAGLKEPTGAHWLGIHMEGPFLSQDYKAVMRPDTLRMPSLEQFKQMRQAAGGRLKYMTIAPELPGALDVISYGMRNGVGMMVGHSGADCQQAEAGLHAGALGFTHFYNAMSQHEHRLPGVVTAGLASRTALCELIADGYHVHPDVIRATYRVLGPRQLALITDATLMRGLPDGTYPFSGYQVHKKDGTAKLDNGRLAGSVIGMDQAVRKMIAITGCGLNDIVRMASINPAQLARVSQTKGSLQVGHDADMILMDDGMQVAQTFIMGRPAYSRA